LPEYDLTRTPPFWGEDEVVPRIYGRGFMKGALAPRGWIAKTDPEGKSWEIIATGFRNPYDAAFNHDGELFTDDSDMEWDLNTTWYRPTRINHVVSGAEFGWRNGSHKWPDYYVDSFGAGLDIGPGSPTGVAFGYGAKFPAKYQNALFICDWSFGKMYAIHIKPAGSTYTAEREEFLGGSRSFDGSLGASEGRCALRDGGWPQGSIRALSHHLCGRGIHRTDPWSTGEESSGPPTSS